MLLDNGKSADLGRKSEPNRVSNVTSGSRASALSAYEEKLTPQHQFSNWMWYNSHLEFENEACAPGLIKDNESIRIIRGFNLLINVCVNAL